MRSNAFLQGRGQARCECLATEIQIGIEQGKGPALTRQFYRGVIGGVAHQFRNIPGHVARLLCVVAQVQHHQGVAQSGIAQPDTAFASGFFLLLRQRPHGDIQDVVQHACGNTCHLNEGDPIKMSICLKWVFYEPGQVD